ncbi:TIGR04552 family protein [Halobacteriovorax sp. GB3]|uniref:TIGR04552 family protein n=1 Tax=Halobacteriovorax sp. GB3 TaxID=2719615 RepID=UPI00235FB51B|nr:TIGR04552 family protein [Halobacteriovorax sp. GB3]MDD0854573.1 TIGR04552 family protein [Halobacteriovorax sp. GB3]
MNRPDYLSKYIFDWEVFDVVIGGKSSLDSKFLGDQKFNIDKVNSFLKSYGLDPSDNISKAELFGNFQEALQFIRRYFLKEGSRDGLDLKIPNSLYMVTDISDVFLTATGADPSKTYEEKLWCEIVLKIMHTILHVDKDLRSSYFNVIQTQIFDKFYKYLYRDEEQNLFLGTSDNKYQIPLIDFETKSKKTRDSVIIKLLHKAENVAEELFDRIGVRVITKTRFDSLLAVKFFVENNVIIPHNIKPSRSVNTMVNLDNFRRRHSEILRMALRNNLSEERFLQALNREIMENGFSSKNSDRNLHSKKGYQSIQFTCRQLIKYKNPFMTEFHDLRKLAKKADENDELRKKILSMDFSLIARDVRFFYPFEVQVVDVDAHKQNTEGEASHQEYKRSQKISAMKRVFKDLLQYKNMNVD